MILEGRCQGYINSFWVMLWADLDFNICFLLDCHNEMARGLIQKLKQTFTIFTLISVLALTYLNSQSFSML